MKKVNDYSPLVRDALFKSCGTVKGSIHDCDNAVEARLHLLAKNYYRKFAGTTKRDTARTERTTQAWRSSEANCRRSNIAIGSCSDFSVLGELLARVRQHVLAVLGESPPRNLFERSGRWSSGATFGTTRGTHYSVKMNDITVTHAVSFMLPALRDLSHNFTVVDGNRMCAVPKTASIDRLIAIEPSGNAFLQQAVGSFVRKRLLSRCDIDLNDQRHNQRGAFHALVDNLATIDLEAASDSISIELVRAVLPHEWFTLLDSLRSHKTFFEGKWVYLDKFSSMGNGFTFELETLIFWAICRVFVEPSSTLLVYGDDIIVPQNKARRVIHALELLGFKTNVEKTFTSGRFFESCGHYYFDLEFCTPPFQKEIISNVMQAMRAHNRLVRWALNCGDGYYKYVRDAVNLLRDKFGFKTCLIPYGSERDDGWLCHPSFVRTNSNGDYVTSVVRSVFYDYTVISDDNAYKYKMYYPGNANETDEGHVENAIEGVTQEPAVRRALVWASSLTA